MIISGAQTTPVYKYNVYFAKNSYGKWKLLSPLDITIGNDNNYKVDKSNKLIYSDVYTYKSAVFYYGKDYDPLVLPNDIDSINGSFYAHFTSIDSGNVGVSSTNIKSVEIPNTVTSIGNNAFCGCSSLMSITIPNRVTSN